MGTLHRVAGVLALGCFACQGVIEAPRWMPPEDEFSEAQVDFECGVDVPLDPPMRRLSRTQLTRTLEDTLARFGVDEGAVLREVEGAVAALPADLRTTDERQQQGQLAFFRADQSVGPAAVEAHYRLGIALGEALSAPERLRGAGYDCLASEGATDAACIDRFVRELGRLTHRRPLREDEFRFYRDEVYLGGDTVGRDDVRDVVTVLFAQPNFLFHVEGTGALDGYELANRLSYHLWDTMPDEALFAAAESGDLLTSEGWAREVERVLADDRARAAITSFLREWFRFDHLNVASSGRGADFEAIAGDLDLDASFDAAVEDELIDLFLHVVRSGGTFEDFFLADVTTTTHPTLARIYGVEPAAPGEVVPVPPERRGILTRSGMLLARAEVALPTINSITHPILRGVFVRRQITCDNLPPAPGGAMDDLPVIDRSVTGSREATETLTAPLGCSECHGRINPTGYALERFDAIGQYRDDEPLFDGDGNETMRLPIDDSATVFESDAPITGGAALAQALFDSEKAGACFARHYARFTLGRTERLVEDGCLLRAMDEAIDEGRPLSEVLTILLLEPSYRTRTEN